MVTGGAGFIGSHLVEALLDEGCPVRVVDSLVTGHRSNLAHLEGRFEWLEGDLASFGVAREAVEGAEFVFHQAAIPSVPRSVRAPIESHEAGPTATLNVLEAARLAGARRVMFAASSSAYGDTDELPKHEGMLPRPLSPLRRGQARRRALRPGLRPDDGPRRRLAPLLQHLRPEAGPLSPYSGVISVFAARMAAGERPTIYGDGSQTRDFTHVANVVAANMLAMKSEHPLMGEAYNVGVGGRVSLLDLVAALNRIRGTALDPEFLPARAGDVRDSQASLERIAAALGYRPVVDFEDGLRRPSPPPDRRPPRRPMRGRRGPARPPDSLDT